MLKEKLIAFIKHRVAVRKDIKGFEVVNNGIVEFTKTGKNIWVFDNFSNFSNYEKVFIVQDNIDVKELLRKDYPRNVYIVIFINDHFVIINPWIIKRYENPERALKTILENGA